MERSESLKDGTLVILRDLTMEDLQRSRGFFRSLPAEDRKYLRFDVTSEAVVTRLIQEAESGRAYRVVALMGDEIVGHGALQFPSDDWHRHIGELRVIVAPEYRRKGLGGLLIGQLFREAEHRGIEKAVMRLVGPQMAVRKVLEQYGFGIDAVLEDHVKDADGQLQPLVVMSCALDEVAKAMRDFYSTDDWPDG